MCRAQVVWGQWANGGHVPQLAGGSFDFMVPMCIMIVSSAVASWRCFRFRGLHLFNNGNARRVGVMVWFVLGIPVALADVAAGVVDIPKRRDDMHGRRRVLFSDATQAPRSVFF